MNNKRKMKKKKKKEDQTKEVRLEPEDCRRNWK
jgi:hypothetical protein